MKRPHACTISLLFLLNAIVFHHAAGSSDDPVESLHLRPHHTHHHELGPGAHADLSSPPAPAQTASSGRQLDIVLVHYQQERLQQLREFWPGFIANEKVAPLRPAVWVYCHSQDAISAEGLEPLFRYGGRIVPQANFGREVGCYLEHIVSRWDDFADHTLFSQDLPSPTVAPRFLRWFDAASTGFLPLAVNAAMSCDDTFIPHGLIPQMYSLFTRQLCPPEGYSAAFNGEFVVSRQRIKRQSRRTYSYLLDLAAAKPGHWIHYRERPWQIGDSSNPMFAHLMERTWSLAFGCYDPVQMHDCGRCNNDDCDLDYCLCLDA